MTECPPSHTAFVAAPHTSFDYFPRGAGGRGELNCCHLRLLGTGKKKNKISELAWLCSQPVQLCNQDRLPEGRGTSESCHVVRELH